MPRQARMDVPGALHHIMVRAIDKTKIFRDDEDKARFPERLGQTVAEGKSSVYAWILMDNHVHLLFKSGKDGISTAMRKLLTWYAQYCQSQTWPDRPLARKSLYTIPCSI